MAYNYNAINAYLIITVQYDYLAGILTIQEGQPSAKFKAT